MLFFLPNDIVMQKINDGTTSYTLYKYIAAFITIVIAFVVYIMQWFIKELIFAKIKE